MELLDKQKIKRKDIRELQIQTKAMEKKESRNRKSAVEFKKED